MAMTDEERREAAEDAAAWLLAYEQAGFTRAEGHALLIASCGRANVVVQASEPTTAPEMLEFLQKHSRLAEAALGEMSDE